MIILTLTLITIIKQFLRGRVCTKYLSSLDSKTLNSSSCSIIYTIDSIEAKEAIEFINRETNHWIQVG